MKPQGRLRAASQQACHAAAYQGWRQKTTYERHLLSCLKRPLAQGSLSHAAIAQKRGIPWSGGGAHLCAAGLKPISSPLCLAPWRGMKCFAKGSDGLSGSSASALKSLTGFIALLGFIFRK